MACSKHYHDLRLVMVGKTGTGKSNTANTILGERRFLAGSSGTSLTKKCIVNSANRYERDIHIVDTPGLFDTDDNNDMIDEIIRCIGLSTPGPHALLFTIPIGRFTEEDIQTVNKFTSHFGEKMKDYIIIVFTRFDDWKRDHKGQECKFEKYIESLPEFAKHFVRSQCNNRYIPFDNTLDNAEDQVKTLITKIDEMVSKNNGTFYSNEYYEKADKIFKEKREEEKREMKKKMKEEKKIRDAEIRKIAEQKIAEETKKMDKEYEDRKKKITMECDERLKAEQKLFDAEYRKMRQQFVPQSWMENLRQVLNFTDSLVHFVGTAYTTGSNISNTHKLPEINTKLDKIEETIAKVLAKQDDISMTNQGSFFEHVLRNLKYTSSTHRPMLFPSPYQSLTEFDRL